MTGERAEQLIMTARVPWFAEQASQAEQQPAEEKND